MRKCQAAKQPRLASRFALFDPGRAFDHQQPVEASPLTLEPDEQLGQRRYGAGYQHVELGADDDLLRRRMNTRTGRPSSRTISCTALAFLATESQSDTSRSGRTIASTMPGTPPPVPTSSTRAPESKKRLERQAIDDVAGDELLVVGVPREVELFVPAPQRVTVAVEQLDLLIGQFDMVPLERGGQGIGDGFGQRRLGGQEEGRCETVDSFRPALPPQPPPRPEPAAGLAGLPSDSATICTFRRAAHLPLWHSGKNRLKNVEQIASSSGNCYFDWSGEVRNNWHPVCFIESTDKRPTLHFKKRAKRPALPCRRAATVPACENTHRQTSVKTFTIQGFH